MGSAEAGPLSFAGARLPALDVLPLRVRLFWPTRRACTDDLTCGPKRYYGQCSCEQSENLINSLKDSEIADSGAHFSSS